MALTSLKKKKDFERVFKKGAGFKNNFLFLKLISNGLAKSRFGIIVSPKVSKKASLRNKIRRRIKAAIYQKLPQIKDSLDVVLSALPGSEDKSFREIQETVNNLFKRAKIIR